MFLATYLFKLISGSPTNSFIDQSDALYYNDVFYQNGRIIPNKENKINGTYRTKKSHGWRPIV